TFQAIRMAVNREQEELAHLLSEIPSTMAQGGRLALISFHSLEDRMVKQAMRRWQEPCECPRDFPHCVCGKQSLGHQLTPRPLTPSTEELERNARARSAKLRVFEFSGGTP
ncbi:MAG: 16S rRNA (cytosine(1402)-N(4))-methyltransferase, partial [Deltaproteobacteria bacterium]|nr:16S rRNA (cytosine(1402)-N(4))-methyltransferase [Deltaproteobacteria bacterium]